jgi:hypothetical protein
MAQALGSSAPPNSPVTPSEIHDATGATISPPSLPLDDGPTVDRCAQEMAPSYATTVSHSGDCNLECCYCEFRWSARRNLLQEE